jgi:prepilin-type N-terminal cleavage/methylation domain-containing protein
MKLQLKKSVKAQKGFTLVELSVVVLVAGLMLTAVMKGQSMLETARAQKMSSDIKNIEALIGHYETAAG